MVQNIKQGFYKVIKDEMITNFLFLDEDNVFICSLSISKLVNLKDIKEAIKNIKEHSKYEGEAMFIETVSKNFAANKPIEMHGITNATFSYKEINEGNIRGIISQVVHTRYPLTGKKELFSNSYIIRNNNLLKDYKALIDVKPCKYEYKK